jgi:hypothetical protein
MASALTNHASATRWCRAVGLRMPDLFSRRARVLLGNGFEP